MSTNIWTGNAPAVAQVNTITVGGTPATGQIYTVTIGSGVNVVSVSYSALVADTNTTIATGLYTLLAASTIPQFSEITWANPSAGVITGTASTAGKPFTQTSSSSGTGTLTTQAGIATPSISSSSTATSGGTLTDSTTYYYRLSALNAAGETLACTEHSQATGVSGSNVNTITINWSAPSGTGITGYRVYGRTTGAEQLIATVGAGTTSYIDDGTVSPSGALPVADTTAGSGPNDWACPLNWSLGAVPVASDDVYVYNTANAIQYNLDQSSVTLASLNIDSTMTGDVGLPNYDATGGYYQYRTRYLKIGATTVNIGTQIGGQGTGSGRIKLDAGSTATTWNVFTTGSAAETGLPAVILKGSSGSNVLNVQQGTVGVAVESGDTATVATIRVGYQTSQSTDVTLTLGSGCTLTTLNQYGGSVTYASNVTTHTMYGGTATVLKAAAVTTLSMEKGANGQGATVYYETSGTLGTLTVGDGCTADFSRDPRARTATNCTVAAGGTLTDPNKTVTFTNPFALSKCSLADVTLNLGTDFSLQRS